VSSTLVQVGETICGNCTRDDCTRNTFALEGGTWSLVKVAVVMKRVAKEGEII